MTRCMAGWEAVEPLETRLVGTLAPPLGRDEGMTWRKA